MPAPNARQRSALHSKVRRRERRARGGRTALRNSYTRTREPNAGCSPTRFGRTEPGLFGVVCALEPCKRYARAVEAARAAVRKINKAKGGTSCRRLWRKRCRLYPKLIGFLPARAHHSSFRAWRSMAFPYAPTRKHRNIWVNFLRQAGTGKAGSSSFMKTNV